MRTATVGRTKEREYVGRVHSIKNPYSFSEEIVWYYFTDKRDNARIIEGKALAGFELYPEVRLTIQGVR